MIKLKNILNEQETATTVAAADGKTELVDVLKSKLNAMETSDNINAPEVAKIIYNTCAQWMNKTDLFANRPGQASSPKAAMAPKIPNVFPGIGQSITPVIGKSGTEE
jgi:hypothetical protein